jgi:RimJ/RimL family protein N-acetyltransferase
VTFADPLSLTGDLVRLDPLQAAHCDELADAARDGELWTLQYTSVPRPEQMRDVIEQRLAAQRAGAMLAFTTRRRDTGRVIGMTNYWRLDAGNRRVEIGGTWTCRSAQRSGTNTESKLLLLGHAFDEWHCIAVEFRTHWLNQQSRRAIERLGAKQDGVLRSHQVMADGTLRDTVVYSIIAIEWPAVRNELERRLADHRTTSAG